MKRWGKSPPRFRQRRRHGKPHREQGRIGVDGEALKGVVAGAVPPFRPGWPREARSDAGSRGMAAQARQRAGQNPAYRPSDASRRRRRREAFVRPSDGGRPASAGLAFAPCTVVPGAAVGLGAVALCAPGPMRDGAPLRACEGKRRRRFPHPLMPSARCRDETARLCSSDDSGCAFKRQ